VEEEKQGARVEKQGVKTDFLKNIENFFAGG
jgi:hypothetical protein